MKKFFKKLAVYFVTAYSNRIFKQAVNAAKARHAQGDGMVYVITDPRKESRLLVMNTAEFIDLRHRLHIPSKALTIQTLKNQCWYHTRSKAEKDALTAAEVHVRRLAFVRERLIKAKLA